MFSRRTGRRAFFASRAQTIALLSSQTLPPKLPPTQGWITRMSPWRMPSACASDSRDMKALQEFIQTVSLPPGSHWAIEPMGSM